MEEGIWFNKNVCINNKSVYYDKFYYAGIVDIGDLFENLKIIPFEKWIPDLDAGDFLKWRGLVNAILKYRQSYPVRFKACEDDEEEEVVIQEDASTKFVYKLLVKRKLKNDKHIPRLLNSLIIQMK